MCMCNNGNGRNGNGRSGGCSLFDVLFGINRSNDDENGGCARNGGNGCCNNNFGAANALADFLRENTCGCNGFNGLNGLNTLNGFNGDNGCNGRNGRNGRNGNGFCNGTVTFADVNINENGIDLYYARQYGLFPFNQPRNGCGN